MKTGVAEVRKGLLRSRMLTPQTTEVPGNGASNEQYAPMLFLPHLSHFTLAALSYRDGQRSTSPISSLMKRRHTEVGTWRGNKRQESRGSLRSQAVRHGERLCSPGCARRPPPSSPDPGSAGARPPPGQKRNIRGEDRPKAGDTPVGERQLAGG